MAQTSEVASVKEKNVSAYSSSSIPPLSRPHPRLHCKPRQTDSMQKVLKEMLNMLQELLLLGYMLFRKQVDSKNLPPGVSTYRGCRCVEIQIHLRECCLLASPLPIPSWLLLLVSCTPKSAGSFFVLAALRAAISFALCPSARSTLPPN